MYHSYKRWEGSYLNIQHEIGCYLHKLIWQTIQSHDSWLPLPFLTCDLALQSERPVRTGKMSFEKFKLQSVNCLNNFKLRMRTQSPVPCTARGDSFQHYPASHWCYLFPSALNWPNSQMYVSVPAIYDIRYRKIKGKCTGKEHEKELLSNS